MGLSEQIGELYSGIENKFYGGMDFLHDRGIPVYAVIDPLEERGIPAFPVAIASALALIFIVYGLVFLSVSETRLVFSISDNSGASLSGVSVAIYAEDGSKVDLGSGSVGDGDEKTIAMPIGAKLKIEAKKDGYETASQSLFISKETQVVSLKLAKGVVFMEGALRLVDAETDDVIEGAEITAKLSDEASVDCIESSRGVYACPGVILGGETTLTIDHPDYEQKTFKSTFASDSINEISMTPKPGAQQGKTSFIVRVFDSETQGRAGNFTLMIYDALDNGLITEMTETDNDGEQVEKITKGTSVRLVVKKENYITYDSGVLGENLTLRGDEVIQEIYLRPGSSALTVGVLDVTGRPLEGKSVWLFNGFGEILDEATTNLAGEVVFEGLDPNETYYVSSWENNFIPSREKAILSEKNSLNLVMQRATADNSGSLTVYAADGEGNALNDVSLNFLEETEGEGLVALGIPAQKTDITGKFEMLAPLGKTITVNAQKGNLEGQETVKIADTFGNEVFIKMMPPYSELLMKIQDASGNEMAGAFVSVSAGTEVLYEGEYEEGGFIFNPEGNDYVDVYVTSEDGETFSEEVFVAGLEEVTVSPGGSDTGPTTNPIAEYLGVFDVSGNEASGLSKGTDYYLKFRIVFPEGNNQNGFHVRLGEDSVRFADSQDAGILGFSASGAKGVFGRSYSPEPSPGFEATDFENAGEEGSYNKFLELYFESGGEKIIKVRVKAKETASEPDILLNYRAWSTIGNVIYRTPEDAELGTGLYSDNKTALYSETLKERIRILEASATCNNEFCASYKFVRSDGSEYEVDDFKAVLGELYAIEVNISPQNEEALTIKASTSKTKPKLGFQGFAINDSANFPDLNSSDTSIEVEDVAAFRGETTKVRLFFKAKETENSSITLQLISGETVLNEQFYFEIYGEQNLLLKTIPETVTLGEDFVILLENDAGSPVENAEIILTDDSGKHLETLSGNGAVNKGGNGRYSVKNSFGIGTIHYEASADRHRPLTGTIDITKDGVISWLEDEVYLVISKDAQSAQVYAQLENSSKQNITELSFEIVPAGAVNEEITLEVTPLSGIMANSSQKIGFVAEYTGAMERAHSEAKVIARGRTDTGYTVVAETRAIIDYNPLISQGCVEFSKKRLAVYVASGFEDRDYYDSVYGDLSYTEPTKYYAYQNFTTTATESFTASLADRPECQNLTLELVPETVPEGKKTEGLEVEAETIRLSPQLTETEGTGSDTDEVTVTITNNLIRNYAGKEKFGFEIVFKADGFEKTLPVDVYVWNPRYALQFTNNIELFLGPDNQGRLSAQTPLFVRNVGEADIENVQFRVSSATGRGNVDVTVVPDVAIQFLQKGQAILPPKTLLAQVLRNDKTTISEVKELDITGVIDGRTFSFGPIIVNIHASGAECLTATPGSVQYYSTKSSEGAMAKEIRVLNTCAEEARIVGLSETKLGNNRLSIEPANSYIPAGSEATLNLVLEKNEDFSGSPVPVYINAFLPRSGNAIQSSPVLVEVRLGKDYLEGKDAVETQVLEVCETKETKEVRFPSIATGNNAQCDNSYCDAEQLAEYLTNKIEQKIKDAEKQISSYSSLVQKAQCSQEELARGYCSFSGLGISPETFIVYMQHDNLTPELLQKSFEQRSGSIKNFTADYLDSDNAGEYLGGYSRQIFMNNNMRGCGRYTISLNGAVRVQSGNLLPELMNVVIDLTPEEDEPVRQVTEQCSALIQNIGNFMPKDESLSPNQKTGAWLGVVETNEKGLDELKKTVAKRLFGNENRATTNSPGVNKIELAFGNQEGYIVKVDMVKTVDESPKTISAFVRESVGGDEELQKAITSEAAQAIADLREGVIDGCIAEDESYFMLKSSKDSAKLSLDSEEKISVLFNAYECADINVSSNIKETAKLTARKEGEFEGIEEKIIFRDVKGNEITEIEIKELDEKTKRYVAKAQVCVKGNAQFGNANARNIIVEVTRAEGQGKKAEPKTIALQVCGIHPLKFLESAGGLEASDEPYYATFIWKGDPESFKIGGLEALSDFQNAAKSVASDSWSADSGRSEEENSARRKASYAYLGACATTSAVTSFFRPTIGLPGALFNILFDCGVPFAYQMWGDTDAFKDITGFISKVTGPIIDALKKGIDSLGFLKPVVEGFAKLFGLGSDESTLTAEQLNAADRISTGDLSDAEFQDNIIGAFVPSNMIYSILQQTVGGQTFTVSPGGSVLTRSDFLKLISKNDMIASNIAEEIAKQVEDNAFRGTTNDFGTMLRRKLQEKIKARLDDLVKKNMEISLGSAGRTVAVSDDQLKTAVTRAVEDVGKDESVLQEFFNARNGLDSSFSKTAITDEAIDGMINDLKVNSTDFSSKTFRVKGDELLSADDILDDARITNLEEEIQEKFLAKLRNELGEVDAALESQIRSVRISPEISDPIVLKESVSAGLGETTVDAIKGADVKITDDSIESMVKDIKSKIKNSFSTTLADTAEETSPSAYVKKLREKFGKSGYKKTVAIGDDVIQGAKPRFFGRGGLLFLRNLITEGALGALANAMGLKAYDYVYNMAIDSQSGAPEVKSIEEERQELANDFLGLSFEGDAAQGEIWRYRTYPVFVSVESGQKTIRIGEEVSEIPAKTKAEMILNDCADPGFNDELGAAFPGILPNINSVPDLFRGKDEEYRKVLNKYLEKQEDGSRIAVLIASAVKEKKAEFNANSGYGFKLEAMVASIGVAKTGLGIEGKNNYMFGCGINEQGREKYSTVYASALCTVNKLTGYASECNDTEKYKEAADSAYCYYEKYSNDTDNQNANYMNMAVGRDKFFDLYSEWDQEIASAS